MALFEFTEDEVPYAILGEYGLTREMVEDLPENPYQYILRGLLSPALPITVRDDRGTPSRLAPVFVSSEGTTVRWTSFSIPASCTATWRATPQRSRTS